MIPVHSRIEAAQGYIVRHRSRCAACGNPLGNEWSDILVRQGRFNELASVCNRCAARAEATAQGYADVVADVRWRARNA